MGWVKVLAKTVYAVPGPYGQFLRPINSSTRPSYVSCVRRGEIMSTRRSIMTNESTVSECALRWVSAGAFTAA